MKVSGPWVQLQSPQVWSMSQESGFWEGMTDAYIIHSHLDGATILQKCLQWGFKIYLNWRKHRGEVRIDTSCIRCFFFFKLGHPEERVHKKMSVSDWPVGKYVWVFSWLMINVGSTSTVWVVPTLGRWCQCVQERWLIVMLRHKPVSRFLCLSSCLQAPALSSCPDFNQW